MRRRDACMQLKLCEKLLENILLLKKHDSDTGNKGAAKH